MLNWQNKMIDEFKLDIKKIAFTKKNPLVVGKEVLQFEIDTDWDRAKIVWIHYDGMDAESGIIYTNDQRSHYKPFVHAAQLKGGKIGYVMRAYSSKVKNEARMITEVVGEIVAPKKKK